MPNKKRPQYIQDLVNKVNEHLRHFKVKEEYKDSLFSFMTMYLIERKMYEGYNYYKDMYNPYLNKTIPTLAGSYNKDEYEYLQIN